MKTCCDCNRTLSFDNFVPKASGKDGYEIRCRKCRTIRYNKSTPELLAKKIYNTQLLNSSKRGHLPPNYTLKEFTEWLVSQPNFIDLFDEWKASDYSKDKAPSADRIDPNLGYSINNIQLMSWEENKAKAGSDKATNLHITSCHRGVASYKDGVLVKEYPSMAEAMRDYGGKVTASYGISTVCNGVPVKDGKGKFYTPRSYKGLQWKWL